MTIWNIPGDPFILLSTFQALFEHRSVVRAAEALGVTQSAVSKHLSKLRQWFNDDLFLRTSEGMQPTLKAISIRDNVQSILRGIESLSEDTVLEPSMLRGEFVLSTTDEVRRQLLPPLLKKIEEEAPLLRLTLIPLSSDYAYPYLETGRVQLVISVNWHAPSALIQKQLWQDSFVCVLANKNKLADKALSLEDYTRASHLLVAPLGQAHGYIDDLLLAQQQTRRNIRLSLPNFCEVTPELLGAENLVTLPLSVAKTLASDSRLCIKELPLEVPSFAYYMFWHQRFTHHPLNVWMRDNILAIVNQSHGAGLKPSADNSDDKES